MGYPSGPHEPKGMTKLRRPGKHKHVQHFFCRKCNCKNNHSRKVCIQCGHGMEDRMDKPWPSVQQSREKKFLVKCPTGCTQKRTKSYRLSERKTFDTRTQTCSNCGFTKLPLSAKFHGPGFKKVTL